VPDLVCPVCSIGVETPYHMVWECLASMVVWQECYWRIQKLSLMEDDSLGCRGGANPPQVGGAKLKKKNLGGQN
jgi:hypothetical protein